jgi:hypothetical protein
MGHSGERLKYRQDIWESLAIWDIYNSSQNAKNDKMDKYDIIGMPQIRPRFAQSLGRRPAYRPLHLKMRWWKLPTSPA